MAKKIRFPLQMNETDVRTIEELREHFDIESVLGYFANGKLVTWLRDRYYDDEANEIEQLREGDTDLNAKICKALGVEYENSETDLETIKFRNEKLMKLRQLTSDQKIIESVDVVAFSQDELFEILDEDTDIVYLCGEKFSIPLGRQKVCYKGVNKPLVLLGKHTLKDFEDKGITFENTRFEDGVYTPEPEPEPAVKKVRSCGNYTNKTFVNQLLSKEQCERAEKMYNSIEKTISDINLDIDADVYNMKRIINDAHICDVGKRFIDSL